MKTAKMAVLTGTGRPFELREYPLTAPPAGMAQIRLIASGICGTDVHIQTGRLAARLPAAIGHEFAGEVTALSAEDSAASGIRVGNKVLVDIACPCGKCALCLAGDDANCLNMGVTNGGDPNTAPHFYGGYGRYNYSPVKNLVPIPDALDPQLACAYACAGPTCLHAFRLAARAGYDPAQAQTAVVQGLGPVGSFAVLYLAQLGVRHVVSVLRRADPQRVAAARSLGATEVYCLADGGAEAVTAQVMQLSGVGADLVIEASGDPQAFAQGLELLRNRGVYLVPGQYSNSGPVSISPQLITFRALRILGSSQYSLEDVADYLQFLQQHPELHDCIRQTVRAYPLEAVNTAFADAAAGRNGKTVLV